MSLQLDIDESLSLDDTVYRIVDFFSAAQIVSENRIMFSRVDTFHDKNEGVDKLLSQLEVAGSSKGCGMGWNDKDSGIKRHEDFKRSNYVSCWSKACDSVSMWSLYSQDFCSVRISTKILNLKSIAENFIEKYSFMRLHEGDLGSRVVLCAGARITPVVYKPLTELLFKTSRRFKAFKKLEARYNKEGRSFPNLDKVPARYWKREEQRRIVSSITSCSLKDISFDHEKEVRIVIRLGEVDCDKRILEFQQFAGENDKYHMVVKRDLEFIGSFDSDRHPSREYVECPGDFIETVAVDPRCPAHKQKFIRDWFEKHGVKVVQSDCFGYLPDLLEVYPSW